ncbi:MAG: adenylosuccinate lyase family protein [Rhodospirillales bacterium]|nr:adenylosuccinate lyase family protein [Rhodospirillales bacterium]
MAINPAEQAIYGGLYGSDAMRAVFDERTGLARMLEVEAALARVQAKLGIVPGEAAEAIAGAAALENLSVEEIAASTRVVGYPVVGLTKALAKAAGAEAGRYVHWGATTQDILDTALVLQVRDGLDLLEKAMRRLLRALVAKAVAHRDDVMAGRTHLQHALPLTFGYKCAVWANPLIDDLERIAMLRPRVLKAQFGGAVGTLASLGDRGRAVTEGLAAALGLLAPTAPWHVARDSLAEVMSVLAIHGGNLAKFATDIVLLMQTEIAEVFEPHQPGRGSSSTMPQKRNPIACEYVLAAVRGAQSLAPMVASAMAQDHERATGPWQAEQLALPQVFVLIAGALDHAVAIAEGMVVDTARMRRNLDQTGGLIMAEAVMMGLAPAIGRQAAHDVLEHACARALAEKRPLGEVLAGEPDLKGRIDQASLARLTDPARYLGECGAVVDRVAARAKNA